ncbi:hypothetical protein [Streptomyces sp. NPDC055099]
MGVPPRRAPLHGRYVPQWTSTLRECVDAHEVWRAGASTGDASLVESAAQDVTVNRPCPAKSFARGERPSPPQGGYLECIRGDRVLREALAGGADPLHLALVFNLSHTTASRYAAIARNLLDDQTTESE